jgi:hypothetical protein
MLSARMAFEEIVASFEAVMRAATPIRSQLSGPADPSSWAHWPRISEELAVSAAGRHLGRLAECGGAGRAS